MWHVAEKCVRKWSKGRRPLPHMLGGACGGLFGRALGRVRLAGAAAVAVAADPAVESGPDRLDRLGDDLGRAAVEEQGVDPSGAVLHAGHRSIQRLARPQQRDAGLLRKRQETRDTDQTEPGRGGGSMVRR